MQIFEHSIIHNPSHVPWGHVRSHTKFGPDRFNRFDRQTNKIYIYIHTLLVRFCFYNVYKEKMFTIEIDDGREA